MTEKLQEIKPAKTKIDPVYVNFKNDVMNAFPKYEDQLFTETYFSSQDYSKRSEIESTRKHIRHQTLKSLTDLEETIATKCRLLELLDPKARFAQLILAQIEICQYLYTFYFFKYSKM